ncbi:MAG TPA: hypothetical protein VF739_09730 [Ktedonobacterales bacterium]
MFTVEFRDRVRRHALAMAAADPRVVAGAVVGSMALAEGDRWSDLDLTFAVADEAPLKKVLDEWTRQLVAEFDAVQLFDLPAGESIYRVLLLPGCLQFDLSFTPASAFGALGPRFRLLFGAAVERPFPPSPSAGELFGYAAHHAVRARFCIERDRFWQAEYWISGVRDYGMSLACLRRGLPVAHGRGFDALPTDVRAAFAGALMRSLERDELLRALDVAVAWLLREAEQTQEIADVARRVASQLRELTRDQEG